MTDNLQIYSQVEVDAKIAAVKKTAQAACVKVLKDESTRLQQQWLNYLAEEQHHSAPATTYYTIVERCAEMVEEVKL